METKLNDQLPCRRCILVGICRHKSFLRLLTDCVLVKKFMDRSSIKEFNKSASCIHSHLRPDKWSIEL